jgi:hypothetical protein
MMPQVGQNVLSVGNNSRIGTQVLKDIADLGSPWPAFGQGRKHEVEFQVTRALGL